MAEPIDTKDEVSPSRNRRSRASVYYYDPYEKRVVERPLTNLDAFISLLKCVIGSGILAMPLAFRHAGIVVGFVLSIILVSLLTYAVHLLILGMTECCRRARIPQVSMPGALKIALLEGPTWGYCFAYVFSFLNGLIIVASEFTLCTVYVVFGAKNYKEIGDHYWQEMNLQFYVIVVCIVLFPPFMIRSLKFLVPLNTISNILLYISLILIVYCVLRGLPSVNSMQLAVPPEEWLIFMGIASFAFTSVGSMIVVEANMEHPQAFLGTFGVLNMAVLFVFITNLVFGIMGYWRYGENIKPSITLNLAHDEYISQFIRIAIATGILLSYPLNGFVAITVIFSDYVAQSTRERFHYALEYTVRIIFLILTGIVGALVPNLAALMELEGGFVLSILNLFCPAIIDMSLNYSHGYGRLYWKLIRGILLIIAAFFFGTVTCRMAMAQLIQEFKETLGISKKDK